MLAKWPIRNKLLIGIGLLVAMVATLAASGFLGLYAYRTLVRNLRNRADELPLAAELAGRVSDLRVSLSEAHQLRDPSAAAADKPDVRALSRRFDVNCEAVKGAIDDYCYQLTLNDQDDLPIGNNHKEQATVARLKDTIAEVTELTRDADWPLDESRVDSLNSKLELAQSLTSELPSFLHRRIHDLAGEVRTRYRTLIVLTWFTTFGALATFGLFIHLFYRWIFRPLRVLIKGSRYIAAGNFGYRVVIDTHDEMAELAAALNEMTSRFRSIRDDLDRQVQIRTKQVVRSEQLASVGFLAAGVAHEINNPLASIAMCAESLEGRLAGMAPADARDADVAQRYLRMIQTEAFRCKEITEKLLDFSRLGEVQQQNTELRELVGGVIDMVRHVGKYHTKRIELVDGEPVVAPVNPQEIKQVVLNLITNALDSLEPEGKLTIDLRAINSQAELTFTDDGCGMTDEVLEHLFEPFFTRKRGGQGTGLGLSIVYRIVADHGGQIDATSAGPGRGSQFRVTLPLVADQKEKSHRYQAA